MTIKPYTADVTRLALVLTLFMHPLLAQTARVEGTVRTSTGDPVPRATIQLVNTPGTLLISPDGDRKLAGFTTTTDDSGRFVLENVQPGRNYRLSAMKAGFLDGNLPAQLTLNAGETIRDLVIEMGEQGVITGRVIDLNGGPLIGALVTLQQSRYVGGSRVMSAIVGSGTQASQVTDDRGVYRFANVAPGRYYAVATDQTNRRDVSPSDFKSGQQANITTYYPSADNADGARAIDVRGDRAQSTDILMRRAATFALRGSVIDEATGKPMPEARVLVVTVNGRSVRANPYARPSGDDGTFEFTAMPPGSYELEVATPALPGAIRRIGRAQATILAADVSGVTVRVGNGVTIRGIVQLESGGLPPSFFSLPRTVVFAEGPLPVQRVRGRVANDGTFTMDALPPTRFTVSFTELPEDVYLKSIRFGDVDVLRSPLDLSSGRGGSLTITLSNKPATVGGLVRNSGGETMKGMAVALWPKELRGADPTGGVRRAVTDQNGSYRFAALAPGEYYVAAFPGVDLSLLESHDFFSKFNGEAARVELSEGAQSRPDAPILPAERLAAEIARLP